MEYRILLSTPSTPFRSRSRCVYLMCYNICVYVFIYMVLHIKLRPLCVNIYDNGPSAAVCKPINFSRCYNNAGATTSVANAKLKDTVGMLRKFPLILLGVKEGYVLEFNLIKQKRTCALLKDV